MKVENHYNSIKFFVIIFWLTTFGRISTQILVQQKTTVNSNHQDSTVKQKTSLATTNRQSTSTTSPFLNLCQPDSKKKYRIYTSSNAMLDEVNETLTQNSEGEFSLNLIWRFVRENGSDNVYYIINSRNNYTVEFDSVGTGIKLSNFSYAESQQWIIEGVSDPYCRIATACCNDSLTAYAGFTEPPSEFFLSVFTGNSAQLFRFEEYTNPCVINTTQKYRIIPASNYSYSIHSGLGFAPYYPIIFASSDDGLTTGQWAFIHTGGTVYFIQNIYNGYFVDNWVCSYNSILIGMYAAYGANVCYTKNSNPQQYWLVSDYYGYCYFRSTYTLKTWFLTEENQVYSNWFTGDITQLFHIEPLKPKTTVRTSTVTITSTGTTTTTSTTTALTSTVRTVDCKLSEWQPYSSCSITCGRNSIRSRKRTITAQPTHGGQVCDKLEEVTLCTDIPSVCIPMTPTQIFVSKILNEIGCSVVIGCITVTTVILAIFRSKSFERMLHLGQEITLLIAHVCIITLFPRTGIEIYCKLAAIVLQLMFIANNAFILLEALHTYSVITNVISQGRMFGYKIVFLLCIIMPAIVTLCTAVFLMDEITSELSCWLNLASKASLTTLIPVFGLNAISIITIESTHTTYHKPLPLTSISQYKTALVNQHSLLFKLPINFSAWFMAMFAMYYQRFELFHALFGLNIAVAVEIIMFDLLADSEVHNLIDRIKKKWFICC